LEEDIIVKERFAGPTKKMKCAVKQVAGKAIAMMPSWSRMARPVT